MQRKIWNIFGCLSLAALAILIGALPAYADNPVTFSITGLSGNLRGEYTSPYAPDNVGTVACDSGSGGIWSGAPNPFANNTQKLYAAAADLALDIFHSTGDRPKRPSGVGGNRTYGNRIPTHRARSCRLPARHSRHRGPEVWPGQNRQFAIRRAHHTAFPRC